MSKKHFEAFAKALGENRPLLSTSIVESVQDERCFYNALAQWRTDVTAIVSVLAKSNPHFNESKFMQAVGF